MKPREGRHLEKALMQMLAWKKLRSMLKETKAIIQRTSRARNKDLEGDVQKQSQCLAVEQQIIPEEPLSGFLWKG